VITPGTITLFPRSFRATASGFEQTLQLRRGPAKSIQEVEIEAVDLREFLSRAGPDVEKAVACTSSPAMNSRSIQVKSPTIAVELTLAPKH
jgi:hypothetical protein